MTGRLTALRTRPDGWVRLGLDFGMTKHPLRGSDVRHTLSAAGQTNLRYINVYRPRDPYDFDELQRLINDADLVVWGPG